LVSNQNLNFFIIIAERKIKEFEETNDDNSDEIELISSKDFKCPSKNCNGIGNIHPDKKAHYRYFI